jgi:hypothetical protein
VGKDSSIRVVQQFRIRTYDNSRRRPSLKLLTYIIRPPYSLSRTKPTLLFIKTSSYLGMADEDRKQAEDAFKTDVQDPKHVIHS